MSYLMQTYLKTVMYAAACVLAFLIIIYLQNTLFPHGVIKLGWPFGGFLVAWLGCRLCPWPSKFRKDPRCTVQRLRILRCSQFLAIMILGGVHFYITSHYDPNFMKPEENNVTRGVR